MAVKPVIKKPKDFRDKLDDNLVLWLRFNEGAGTTAYDSSRQFNHGTVSGATYATGKVNEYCFYFDGINDYVDVPHNSAINIDTGDFTIAFWFNPSLLDGTEQALLSKNFSGWGPGYGIRLINNKIEFWVGIGDDTSSTQNWTGDLITGTWYHFVSLRKSDVLYVYLNGTQEETTDEQAGSLLNAVELEIGERAGTRPFKGYLDDIRIYNRALSATEVSHLYTLMGGT